MTPLVLRIYQYMRSHRWVRTLSLLLTTLLLVGLVMRLGYKEDISDFLPLDSQHHRALSVYQDISGAGKLFAIFQYEDTTKADPDAMVAAVDRFVENVQQGDTAHMVSDIVARVDMERMSQVADFVYSNIPYFLTPADYARMDSALAAPDFVERQLQQDKQMLMFPTGSLLSDNIGRDPLGLFTPVVARLQRSGSAMQYEMYDGCIFSPDMQRAIVIISSPYGASETENNARLLSMVRAGADTIEAASPNIAIHLTGGPAIAVGNASQIKTDSIVSVSLAVVLILALLLMVFRNVRNLLLIVVSIAWGWLFAMGALALVHDSVSIIVIGISSVILGIAVNYPLHFIAHLSHTPDKKKALREIVMPLVVGNITTVGAFLALVPLQSTALRDLGLFSSFLLVGTILFVLIYLPHLSAVRQQSRSTILDRIGEIRLENKPVVVGAVIVLTVVFAYFSLDTTFDANMSHINYMTPQQKADMEYFSRQMMRTGSGTTVYALSTDTTMDGALEKSRLLQPALQRMKTSGQIEGWAGCSQFLCSTAEQQRRLQMWEQWLGRHRQQMEQTLAAEAAKAGFAEGSFDEFTDILATAYRPQGISYFSQLVTTVFSSNVSVDSAAHEYSIVDVLTVEPQHSDQVRDLLAKSNAYGFDVESMNSAIANHLSDDFNYIGFACGFIVFFFLWLSLGSIELATLSFLPMAVSWLWILGIMSLCGMQFNIVNVILATFIFGQGDDYTIFMTEGASYEYAYRRRMLASYKHSIIISALIMFIGIGTLIVARHPALHSLAEVTITGMFSVVLMAYIFPPLIFNILVRTRGGYRERPLSLRPLWAMAVAATVFFAQLATVYALGFWLFTVLKPTARRKQLFHRYVQRLYHFDLNHIPWVKYRVDNRLQETFREPAVIVSNHQSMLDTAVFMAMSHRLLIVANGHASSNRVIQPIFRWLDFVSLPVGGPVDTALLQRYVAEGYSIVVFPEGERNARSSVLRFHKGAFYLAEQLQLDIVPVVLHGLNHVLPRNSVCVYPGTITVSVRERISVARQQAMGGYVEVTRQVHRLFLDEYAALKAEMETPTYFAPLVIDRYRYKGTEIFSEVKRSVRRALADTAWMGDAEGQPEVAFENCGYGERALLFALTHPQVKVIAIEHDEDKATVANYSAAGIAPNMIVLTE